MNGFKIVELHPIDGRKSFYGKAWAIYLPNGTICLKSYDTIIAAYDGADVHRLWAGYSATSNRHYKAFCDFCGIEKTEKWKNLPLEDAAVASVIM